MCVCSTFDFTTHESSINSETSGQKRQEQSVLHLSKNRLQSFKCLCLFESETLKAASESILGSSSRMAWKVPLWLYWTTPTLVPGKRSNCVYTKLAAILLYRSNLESKEMCMNQCMSTCIWLGVFGKGSQPVDGVDDKVLLQGEVRQTHWLWAVDHKHDVQGSTAFLTVCRQKHKLWESDKLLEHVQIMNIN